MTLTPDIDFWLREAGYEHHCFISWPHTRNLHLAECARRLKDAIEDELALSVPEPHVFLDESDIGGGADWMRTLEHALCRSVCMVAVCVPIYYHPKKMCGREWAGMMNLSRQRLAEEDFHSVIPVLVRNSDPLPGAVAELQYIDISRVLLRGRRYFTTNEYREQTAKIVSRIVAVAKSIHRTQTIPACRDFQFPAESPFTDYPGVERVLPFREGLE